MCTVLFEPENLQAKHTSSAVAQRQVDELMHIDLQHKVEKLVRDIQKQVVEMTSLEQKPQLQSMLNELQQRVEAWKTLNKVELPAKDLLPGNGLLGFLVGMVASDKIKEIQFEADKRPVLEMVKKLQNQVNAWESLEQKPQVESLLNELETQVDKLIKSEHEAYQFAGRAEDIFVWLDSYCYGNATEKGYYYIRFRDPRTWCTTAYNTPALIVKQSKLRPDQVEFMEQQRIETKEKLSRKREETGIWAM